MKFGDPTFVDAMVRRRQHYRVDAHGDKTRICWLLADAVTSAYKTDREKVLGLMEWTCRAVPHIDSPDYRGRTDFYGLHTLEIIARGFGWCEATSEVFITLAWLAGYPSRRVAIANVPRLPGEPTLGHTVAEVYIPQDGKWSFFDPDMLRYYILDDSTLANAVELNKHPEIVEKSELLRKDRRRNGDPEFLNSHKNDQGRPTYQLMFREIHVQDGTYSLDGFYGRWIKLTPETAVYLYGGPKHPDVKELLEKGRLPFVYTLPSTHRDDYFNYVWDIPFDDEGGYNI